MGFTCIRGGTGRGRTDSLPGFNRALFLLSFGPLGAHAGARTRTSRLADCCDPFSLRRLCSFLVLKTLKLPLVPTGFFWSVRKTPLFAAMLGIQRTPIRRHSVTRTTK